MKRLLLLLMLLPQQVCGEELASPLLFQPESLLMAPVREGETAKGSFLLRNTGEETLTIVEVATSCGCTAAEPQNKVLAPGEFTSLSITIETDAKMGEVRKWVKVTDQFGRVATGWLTLTVENNPHMVRDGKGIFDGNCRSCHYDAVQGKRRGSEIYAAACAMCHGAKGVGGNAPALNHAWDKKHLEAIIRHGVGNPHMPGFARKAGGPLTDRQIRALRQWVLNLDAE